MDIYTPEEVRKIKERIQEVNGIPIKEIGVTKLITTIEELQKLLEKQKEITIKEFTRATKYEQVLKFYADKENYKVFRDKTNGEYEYIHIVDMDEGEKARKALNI